MPVKRLSEMLDRLHKGQNASAEPGLLITGCLERRQSFEPGGKCTRIKMLAREIACLAGLDRGRQGQGDAHRGRKSFQHERVSPERPPALPRAYVAIWRQDRAIDSRPKQGRRAFQPP
jgi:hypothetical protein